LDADPPAQGGNIAGRMTFAASRGEGLHPKLRDLLKREAEIPFSEIAIRRDGMLQAGPNPESETVVSSVNVTLLPRDPANAVAEVHVPKTLRK
jgi:hypothetical protein